MSPLLSLIVVLATPNAEWKFDYEATREMTEHWHSKPTVETTIVRRETGSSTGDERYTIQWNDQTGVFAYEGGKYYRGKNAKEITRAAFYEILDLFKWVPEKKYLLVKVIPRERKKILGIPCVREQRDLFEKNKHVRIVSWLPEDHAEFARFGRLERYDYTLARNEELVLFQFYVTKSIRRG